MNPKFRNLFFTLSASLVATSAQAVEFTFIVPDAFTTGSDNWSTDTKWNAAPVSGTDTSLVFTLQATGNSQTQTTGSVNDIASPFQLNSMTFNSNPSAGNGSLIVALNLSGNALDFVSNGPTTPVINLNGNRTNGQPVQFNVANNVTLGAGSLFTGNGTAAFNFNGIISGSSGFTKSGTSTLTLSNASNDFTGGVTLSAGGLALTNTAALGSNTISVTGNSTISATSGTVSNTINVSNGVTLGLRGLGAANSTTTFSSAITGNVGVTLVSGAASGITVALSSTSNTFTGNLTLPGGTGGNEFISFNSIGDGGSIVYSRLSWRSVATYTGATNLNLSTRNISLSSTFGGLGNTPGLDGGGSPINMFANSGTGVVTMSSDMVIASSANNGVFYFGGSNAGNNTFSGLIADNPGTGVLGIGKWDAGKWILSNANNSFNGNVYLMNGTLSVSNLQALGNGSVIQMGFGANTGTLEYTGSADGSTAKQIVIGNLTANNQAGGATILSNGTGALSFTNSTFNSLTPPWTQAVGITTLDRTLTLGGSSTGANEIQGTIQDNVAGNALVSLSKTGAGTWVLSGANTYGGGTTVSQGTLVFRNTGAKSATGTHAFQAGTTLGLGVGGAGFFSSTDITNAFAGTMTGNLSGITVTATTNVGIDTTAGNFTHSADITGTAKGLTKLGANSLILEGTNTYTGATLVSAGTLIVNGSLGDTAVTVDGGAFGGTGAIGSILSITSGSFHVADINDALQVAGLVTLYAGFGVDDLTGLTWGSVANGTYTLIDGTLDTGVFAGLANNSLGTAYDIGGGRSAYFQEGSLQLVVIPEPRALLLGSLGILLLLRRRRR